MVTKRSSHFRGTSPLTGIGAEFFNVGMLFSQKRGIPLFGACVLLLRETKLARSLQV